MLWTKIKRKIIENRRKCFSLFRIMQLEVNGVEHGENLLVSGSVYIINEGKISLGDNIRINSGHWTNPIGGLNKTYIQIGRGGYCRLETIRE